MASLVQMERGRLREAADLSLLGLTLGDRMLDQGGPLSLDGSLLCQNLNLGSVKRLLEGPAMSSRDYRSVMASLEGLPGPGNRLLEAMDVRYVRRWHEAAIG